MFLRLAYKSLLNRKASVLLTIFAMTVSIVVMLGVEHTREQAKKSFDNSVSGVDLIVGARTGSLNLLLYSVFRLGNPTDNFSWRSYQNIASDNAVSWAFPIALGDSHRGYRVLGTTNDYFTHFSYGNRQSLTFNKGQAFERIFEVVLGAKVAASLNYQIGDEITLSHGVGATSFTHHDHTAFKIVGILSPTGTPIDQTVHISVEGLEAIHLSPAKLNAIKGKLADVSLSNSEIFQQYGVSPSAITAMMLGLKSKVRVFSLQRKINTNKREPLMAILPGVALSELWQTMSVVESTLAVISVLVVISALLGLSAMLLSSMRERTQELRLMRIIGASPLFIYWLIELEALLITFVSAISAILIISGGLWLLKPWLLNEYGLTIDANLLSISNIEVIGIVFVFALIAAIPSAALAYKQSR